MKKAALLSVSDKSGLKEFAQTLRECGYALLATSGTRSYLEREGIETVSIEEYTAQKEILDGRVKTLHPKIHAGILAKRDDPRHIEELKSNDIYSIEVAVINLYPFSQTLKGDVTAPPEKMVEFIDIGGPTMIRAAAKNFRFVLPLLDPADYAAVTPFLQEGRDVPLEMRAELASKVFTFIAAYDLEIAKYLAHHGSKGASDEFASVEGLVLQRQQSLRYGENPHQSAAFYRRAFAPAPEWQQRNGKELSYNNLLDFDAALRLARSFREMDPTAVIIKHLNPCGVATAGDLLTALRNAKRGDPRSHFGGVLAFNTTVDAVVAEAIREDFAEIVLAPEFTNEALELLSRNKALRVLQTPLSGEAPPEIRAVEGGYLLQTPDRDDTLLSIERCVTTKTPSEQELRDFHFAWRVCAHVKSNAIVLAKDQMLLGVGAGQMSRIDSVEISISKAQRHGNDTRGGVAASDAFFPFPDSIDTLAAQGITSIVAPGGAKRDEEIIARANDAGISLLFVTERHFRH